ncbi:helix-turn-helix transcriptional regulator [Psychromarinibacter halotolerans]|uniref:Helix-turn-helix transcriptional regulator n=1 Tax=Psychromarinibacter halotolerans TaxID=1775175 RepID=A0ABV7GL60_9RHOB|nr:YafY family protein [Psychromarinibacter halotolerans]MDF0597810.1 YafY family protein [Psychromarinibacter halotolerans]
MRRADRLFRIVQALRGGRLRTARQLAETLEVSERTIYRDIVDLQASGVPVEGASGYGYVMADGYEMPPLMFSRDEVVALVAGARLVRAFGGLAMAQAAEEALVKIAAVLPDAERQRADAVKIHALTTEPLPDETRSLIDRLESATDARERMDLAYRDADGTETRRTVRPLGLGFWGKVWTLLAWCELREDFRMFRVDRIASAEPRGTFRPDPAITLAAYFDRERHRRSSA